MPSSALPTPLQQCDRTRVWFEGRKLIYFAGCDYYRLSSHPETIKAAEAVLQEDGLGVAASRMTTGNHRIYEMLETALAKFFGAQSALLVNSGYNTGMVVGQALKGRFSHVLLDERAHPALKDAALFLDAPVLTFAHRSARQLGECLARCGKEVRVILLTDGMFAHDGSVAPLGDYDRLLPRDSWMLVDDSHGAGVLGSHGRGTLEYTGVSRRRVIQTITLSKALGAHGGAILGGSALRRRLAGSRMFTGQTPPALPLAAAALASLNLLSRHPELRVRLQENSARVKRQLGHNDLLQPAFPGPILPVLPGSAAHAARLKAALLQAGIYPPLIKYPGGPPSGYFRFVISSEHTARDLDSLVGVLKQHGN
jgi:7-keto-8-aminopelargonate synthetase-like enzyme